MGGHDMRGHDMRGHDMRGHDMGGHGMRGDVPATDVIPGLTRDPIHLRPLPPYRFARDAPLFGAFRRA
jgi:hypothetical protein